MRCICFAASLTIAKDLQVKTDFFHFSVEAQFLCFTEKHSFRGFLPTPSQCDGDLGCQCARLGPAGLTVVSQFLLYSSLFPCGNAEVMNRAQGAGVALPSL